MKSIYRYIFPVLTTIIVLASCNKEPTPGQTDQTPASTAAEGSRVIAVSFASQTKTTLDGLQPEFEVGKDSILLVSYPENAEPVTDICTVYVDKKTNQKVISTDLTGDLAALYPAKYAKKMPGGTYGMPVPSVQTGKFADANFCGAHIEDGANSATFQNVTALFIINPPAGTKSLDIKSLKPIGADGQRTGIRNEINLSEKEEDRYSVSIPDGPDAEGKYYVALYHGFNLSDLSFEAWFDEGGTTGSIKGIPTSRIEYQAKQKNESYADYNPVAAGTAYTIDDSNWHEYITVANRKWAVENVGEGSETGDFYMWGTSVVAYVEHPSKQDDLVVIVDENPYGEIYQNTWNKSFGYFWNNTPFTMDVYNDTTNTQVFYKYTAEKTDFAYDAAYDGKTILDLEDDAAYVNWGGAWRIPTISELQNVPSDKLTLNGVIKEPNGGDNYEVYNVGGAGYYWPSSLDEEYPNQAQCIKVEGGESSTESLSRYYGCTVRAIVDEPAVENQEDAPQD